MLRLDGLRDCEDVHSVAQRLIDTLSRPYLINGIEVHVSASIGVVAGVPTASLANTVLQDASLAMQEAKRAGGGRHVLFTPSIKDRATRRGVVSPIEFIEIAEECGLIEATVRVARSLGMSTTAEGVKTDGQATLLTTLGCDKGQGYLWSRPMTARAATQWFAAQSEARGPVEAVPAAVR
ncbi:MAG: EAL domain-containing protein [Pseudomonadota bacterium]